VPYVGELVSCQSVFVVFLDNRLRITHINKGKRSCRSYTCITSARERNFLS